MKPIPPAVRFWFGILILLLIPIAALWPVLSHPDEVLAFNDGNIESVLSPMVHFPDALLRIWDNQTFFGQGIGQASLNIQGISESLLGPHHTRREGVAVVLFLCGLAVYWFIRQLAFSRFAAFFTAAVIMLSGFSFSFAVVGLYVRPVAIAFGALSLGFAERGRLTGKWLNYALAGGFLGLAVAEVPDVGALLAICCAVYVAWSHLFLDGPVAWIPPAIQEGGARASRSAETERKSKRRGEDAVALPGKQATIPDDAQIATAISGPRFSPPRLMRLAGVLLLYAACSLLLAWQTMGIMFQTQIKGVTQGSAEDPQARYDWATQWSVPKAETWDFVASTYFGSSMHSESAPYWGGLGRGADWDSGHKGFRNFKLTGWHLGVVPSILLLALAISLFTPTQRRLWDANSRRLAWFVLGMIGVTLMFSWGRYFPAYRLVYALPFFSTIRNPDKWIEPLTLFAGMGLALVLHNVLRRDEAGRLLRTGLLKSCGLAAAAIAAIALILLFKDLGRQAGFVADLAAQGFGDIGQQAWLHAVRTSAKVLAIAVTAGALCGLALLRPARPFLSAGVLACGLALLTGADMLHTNSFYVQRHAYKAILAPNPLYTFLDEHRHEGRLKLLPPQHPLLNNLRMTLLVAKGYDLFDPVSISRMPSDYAAFFTAFDKNPVRMWELAGIRHFVTLPGAVDQLNQMDRPAQRFVERLALGVGILDGQYVPVESTRPDQRPLRIVEFTGALPKYRLVGKADLVPPTVDGERTALARLSAPGFDATYEALVHAKEAPELGSGSSNGVVRIESEMPTEARVTVSCSTPSLLVRATKFNDDWKATIDGRATEVLRVNSVFQGVVVPTGAHDVEFAYRPSLHALMVAAGSRALLLLGVIVALVMKRSHWRPHRSAETVG